VSYRIATQPDDGRSAVSRYGGFTRLITEVGASATDVYGNEPEPEPRTQNLWPWRCIGWPIYAAVNPILVMLDVGKESDTWSMESFATIMMRSTVAL